MRGDSKDPGISGRGSGHMEYGYDLPGKEARTWAMWCHLAALSGYLGVPFGNIIGPLIIWMVKRETDPFIDSQAKESLNFQISLTIYGMVSLLLCLILVGFILLPVVIVGGLILTIIAAIKANDGEDYRYPFTIRLID